MAGFVMCSPSRPVHFVSSFDAQLKIVEYKSIICSGYSAVMHIHNAIEEMNLAVSVGLTGLGIISQLLVFNLPCV